MHVTLFINIDDIGIHVKVAKIMIIILLRDYLCHGTKTPRLNDFVNYMQLKKQPVTCPSVSHRLVNPHIILCNTRVVNFICKSLLFQFKLLMKMSSNDNLCMHFVII
jgi:hypothetical protein